MFLSVRCGFLQFLVSRSTRRRGVVTTVFRLSLGPLTNTI